MSVRLRVKSLLQSTKRPSIPLGRAPWVRVSLRARLLLRLQQMNTTTPINIAAMTPITAPTIGATSGSGDVEAFVSVLPSVGALVELAACEAESVEGMNGRRADGIGTSTPWTTTHNISIHN